MMMIMMMVQINVSQVNIELCLEPPPLARNVRAWALLRLTYCPFLLIYILVYIHMSSIRSKDIFKMRNLCGVFSFGCDRLTGSRS